MVVHDDVLLSGEETGVQNWVSFHPWEVEGKTRCFSGIGDAAVRLHCLASSRVELATGEDSVSDEREGVVPVYRAAFISPAAKRHSLLTMIEAIGPTADAADTVVRLLDNGCVEIRQGTKHRARNNCPICS